jgi:GTP pyrophosphokinase
MLRGTIQANCRQKIKEINHKVSIKILAHTFGVAENKVEAWVEQEHAMKKIFRIATDSIYLQDVTNTLKLYAMQDTLLFPLLKKDRYLVRKQKFENIVIYSNHHISNVYFDYCCHPKRGDDIVGFQKSSDGRNREVRGSSGQVLRTHDGVPSGNCETTYQD